MRYSRPQPFGEKIMAETKFKCIGECGKEFKVGEWECFQGVNHTVEPKTYYLADAPFMSKADLEKDPDGITLRTSRTQVHVIPAKVSRGEDGQLVTQNFQPLVFVMGRFETSNPMEQYYLERSKFPVSYDKWFDVYHTPNQKANIKQGKQVEKERELERKERELDTLLAQAKANVKSGKPASA
jgi:hypothetical protein